MGSAIRCPLHHQVRQSEGAGDMVQTDQGMRSERVVIMNQNLGMWDRHTIPIAGENLVIRCEALSAFLYVAQDWPGL